MLHSKEPGEKYMTGRFFALFRGLVEDIWEGRGGIAGRHNLVDLMQVQMQLDLWVESAQALTELRNTVYEMLSSQDLLCDCPLIIMTVENIRSVRSSPLTTL